MLFCVKPMCQRERLRVGICNMMFSPKDVIFISREIFGDGFKAIWVCVANLIISIKNATFYQRINIMLIIDFNILRAGIT